MPIYKCVGMILVVISTLAIIYFMFKRNEPFFNLRKIFHEHFHLFSNCKSQYFVFYVLPIFLSVGLSFLFSVGVDYFSHLGVVISIILSMLLAILAILCGFDFGKIKNEDQKNNAETTVRQTINAILFCCIIGIALLLLGFIVIAASGTNLEWIPINIDLFKNIVSVISNYLFIVMLLNLLLIVKNMCKIIEAKMIIERNSR